MSSDRAATDSAARTDNRPDDFWIWPLRDEPLVALPLLLVLGGVVTVVWHLGGALPGIAVMVALLTCTWRMWCASCMQIDNRGAGQQQLFGWRRIPSREITRCECRARGLLLQTGEPSPLSAAAGMYLRYGRNRERLIEAVALRCPELLGLEDPTEFEVGAPEHSRERSAHEPAS